MFANAAFNGTKYAELSNRFAPLCETTTEKPAERAVVIADSILLQVNLKEPQ